MAHETIWGAVDDDLTWQQLDELLRVQWPHPHGGTLRISAACIDGGDGGHLQQVLAFCRPRAARRIMAIKGAAGFARLPLQPSKSKMRGGGRLWIVGSDAIKSQLFARLARGNSVRFNSTLSAEFFAQLSSERKVMRVAGGKPVARFERIKGMRAECLDAVVYSWAARTALNLSEAAFGQREAMLKGEPVSSLSRPAVPQLNPWLPPRDTRWTDRW